MATDWAAEQARRTGAELRRLREPRSAQWVSDQTAALGHRVPRTTVSEIENGRRTYVTIAELVVLARALDTAPVALMYPPPYSAEVDLLPGETTTRWFATEWFSGRWNTGAAWLLSADGDAYVENLRPLRAAERVTELEKRRDRLMAVIGAADDQRTRQVLVDDLAELHDEMSKLGAQITHDSERQHGG